MPSYLFRHIHPLLLIVTLITSCGTQERSKIVQGESISTESSNTPDVQSGHPQIAEYVRNIAEDKNGGLWFGTNGYGVAHYDGDSVSYYSAAEGFHGGQVTGITVDPQQNLWFATDAGVVKYDWTRTDEGAKLFTNYSDDKYFGGQRFWSLFADSRGNIWAGAAGGMFKYDGEHWAPFELPYPEEAEADDFITKRTTWGITEDSNGNIWFATNGYGTFKLSNGSFTQYTAKDGLTDNHVDNVMEDSKGNIWLGTRYGGVSKYDGKTFTNYTEDNSIGNNEVCIIYEDRAGNIWLSSEGYGVYKYNTAMAYLSPGRGSFTNYFKEEGLDVRAVQTIFEDSKGRLWVGGGGGLYRLDPASNRFINVTKYGPWD